MGGEDRGGLEAPLLAPVVDQDASPRAPREPRVELGPHRHGSGSNEAVLPADAGAQEQRLAAGRELKDLAEVHLEGASDDRHRLVHEGADVRALKRGDAQLGDRRLLRYALPPFRVRPGALRYVSREREDFGDRAGLVLPQRQDVDRIDHLGPARAELEGARRPIEGTAVVRLEHREVLGSDEPVERASLELGPVEILGKPTAVDRHAAEVTVEDRDDRVRQAVDQRLVARGRLPAAGDLFRLVSGRRREWGRARGRGQGVERAVRSAVRTHSGMCRPYSPNALWRRSASRCTLESRLMRGKATRQGGSTCRRPSG